MESSVEATMSTLALAGGFPAPCTAPRSLIKIATSFHSTRPSNVSGGFPSEMSGSDWSANAARFHID